MNLGEFIKNFSHNNLIRLHYKVKGGCECVLENFDLISMDHEVNNGKGVNRHYINNEVLGIVGIYYNSPYPETINIMIERLPHQPFIEEVLENVTSTESVGN